MDQINIDFDDSKYRYKALSTIADVERVSGGLGCIYREGFTVIGPLTIDVQLAKAFQLEHPDIFDNGKSEALIMKIGAQDKQQNPHYDTSKLPDCVFLVRNRD